MGDRSAKDALFEGLSEVAKALGSGRRAEIVDLLAQGERSVEEIAGELDQSVANTSHHLRALARAGLVTTRRDGTRIHANTAYLTFVGLDDNGHPVQAPPIVPETEEEQRRWAAAELRRAARLESRKRIEALEHS